MFCPNCGKEMSDSAEFCSNCGERTQKNRILKNVKEYLKNKYFKGILIFIVILLVIFFIRNLLFNNSVQTGWIGDCYYDNGTMIKNDWVEYNNNWYYLNDDGRYVKNNWKMIGNDHYYFDSSGAMKKNSWIDNVYYVGNDGKMIKNDWVEYNNNWYYLSVDGRYVKNDWMKIGNDYYYFDSSGAMKKNSWINNEYYVGNDGKMLKNTITPDGYYVGADGKYVPNQNTIDANTIYSTKSNGMDSELIKIYNETYFPGVKINTTKFDKDGKLWVHDVGAETFYHSTTAGWAEIYKIYTTKDNYIEYKLTYSDMRWGMYVNDNYYKNDIKITEAEFNNIRNTFDAMQDMYK